MLSLWAIALSNGNFNGKVFMQCELMSQRVGPTPILQFS
ncbi:hypothetical protein QF001_001460 [Paraburkholderia youngii]